MRHSSTVLHNAAVAATKTLCTPSSPGSSQMQNSPLADNIVDEKMASIRLEPSPGASLDDVERLSSSSSGGRLHQDLPAAVPLMEEMQSREAAPLHHRGDVFDTTGDHEAADDTNNNGAFKGVALVRNSNRLRKIRGNRLDSISGDGESSSTSPEADKEDQSDQQVTAIDPRKGGPSTRREYTFVLCSGIFMSFNSGFVNGNCLSGFAVPSGRGENTSNFTGIASNCALSLAGGDYGQFGFLACMVLSFVFGSCLSGVLTPEPVPYRIEPSYGPTFLIGATFLVLSSVIAALEVNEDTVFYLAAAANGIQNGISSSYSENLIRSTGFTGAASDVSIYIAQLCYGNTQNAWRLLVLCSLMSAFWFGSFVAFYSCRSFTSYSLLINAGLFLLVGGSMVAFICYEMGVSVKEAIMGTWKWKKAMTKLQDAFSGRGSFIAGDFSTEEEQLGAIFDQIDIDNSGTIDAGELIMALQSVGIDMTEREGLQMMQYADTDGDGTLSRDEWLQVARECHSRRLSDMSMFSSRGGRRDALNSSDGTKSSERRARDSR